MALVMTDAEIADSYRTAKDQKAQIKVLAELNGLSGKEGREEIMAALKRAGMEPPKGMLCPRIDEEQARALYNAGLSDKQMAEKLGCAPQTVGGWRKRNGLPWNAEPGFPKREPKLEPERESAPEEAALPCRVLEDPTLPDVYAEIQILLEVGKAVKLIQTRNTLRTAALSLFTDYLDQELPEAR